MIRELLNNTNFWTVAGVLIGLPSLYFTYKAFSQKAIIELFISTKTEIINSHRLNLIFKKGYSNNFKIGVSIHNIGNKDSHSINLIVIFNSEVKIDQNQKLSNFWKEKATMPNYKDFHYINDTKIHPPKTNYSVGEIHVSIPQINQINSGYYFIATGAIQGDFERSCFLILYNIQEDSLHVKHFQKSNINEGNMLWNQMIAEKKSC